MATVTSKEKTPPDKKQKSTKVDDTAPTETCDERKHWVEEHAYYMAESRGFMPGHELMDWYSSETAYLKESV